MRNFLFFWNLLMLCFCARSNRTVTDQIGCRDESGALVDWFYLYKLPSKHNSVLSNELDEAGGLRYLYVSSLTFSQWILSDRLVNDTNSVPGKTLSVIYQPSSDNLVMIYNDEPSNGKMDGTRGHTKGVVVANDISGFWLVHSVPKYPPAMEEGIYSYPKSGTIYGQSFLCISFFGDQIDKVGKQLKFNEPNFYSSFVPEHLKTLYPHLVDALKMETITTAPFYSLEVLQSQHGSQFFSFAKSQNFMKELYEDFVAPHFSAGNYFVETWRHGPGNIDSDCRRPSKVYNIEQISFQAENITFKTMKDHSKWMVSESHGLICVGDINRQEHQKSRGGGTVCQLTKVSMLYNALIKDIEKCKKQILVSIKLSNEI